MSERPSSQAQHPDFAHPQDRFLGHQLETSFRNFHDRVLNHVYPARSGTEKDAKAHEALEHAKDIIARHNHYANVINGREFVETVKQPEQEHIHPMRVGIIHCPEPRIPRSQFSFAINTSEELGGIIATEKRISDGKIIPKSSNTCEVLRSRKTVVGGLLEIPLAHFDSVDPSKGCAANKAFLEGIATYPQFTQDERDNLLTMKPEDANLEHIKRITVPAITNFYNSARETAHRKHYRRVAVPALADTATMGLVFRNGNNNGDELSTAELTTSHRKRLEDSDIAAFGQFRDTFTKDSHFLEFQKTKVALTASIMHDFKEQYSSLNGEINNYFYRNYHDLLPSQQKALKFVISGQIAYQYLTGLADCNPYHPYKDPDARFLVVSDRGVLLGKYLPDQHFGSSAANPKEGVKQIIAETDIMDRHNLVMTRPRILFVCGSVSHDEIKRDSKGVRDAKQEMANLLKAIVANDNLTQQMRNGRLIPIPALLDENTRTVHKIPDFSPYL